jgi:hypothetical protein
VERYSYSSDTGWTIEECAEDESASDPTHPSEEVTEIIEW